MTMNKFITFSLVLATFILSCQAYWGNRGLRVITFGEHTCDFGHPTSLILATSNTCTRKYKEKKSVSFEFAGAREDWWEEKTSNYPWCYHNDGTFWKANWDFCLHYWWSFIVDDDHLLIRESRQGVSKTGTKEKNLYFYYYHTGTSYWKAVELCRARSYEVASFQALFEFKNGQLQTDSDLYGKSIKNIEKALDPLDQTFDVFWIRNENSDVSKCLQYNRYAGWNERVKAVNCNWGRTFVCEKNKN